MLERWSDRAARRDVLLLVIGTLACLLPFIGKAVHLDDPVYVWIARQIHVAPADFFGFEVNWHGTLAPVADFNRNPPGASYLLAAAAWLGGWSETTLHLGMLPAALAAVLGTWALARRCCDEPLLATAVACATPAFLVSATTLMADVPMLACWVWAVVLWERGVHQARPGACAASALLVALAALTKFFGVAVLPLLLAWSLLRERRRLRAYMLWLLLPIAALAGFEAYTIARYGHGILLDAAGYATGTGARTPLPERLVMALGFVGGTLLTPALYLPWLGSRRERLAALLAFPALLGLVLTLGQLGVTPIRLPDGTIWWRVALQAAAFAVAGLPLLALAVAELRQPPREGLGWLLAAWVLGTFTFAAVVNWTVSARVILPMAPAAGILVVRGLERAGRPALAWRIAPLALGLAVSLVVARADFEWAGSARIAAHDLAERYADREPVRFQGHWGFQYYIEPLGPTAFDPRDELVPGTLVIEPCNNTNVRPLPPAIAQVVETARYPSSRWVTVLQSDRGAGFYASVFGALPFALGSAPPESYDVLRLHEPSRDPRDAGPRACGATAAP